MSLFKTSPIALVIKRGTEAVDSLIEAAETLLGQRGDPLDRVVTFRDLYQSGTWELRDKNGVVRVYNGIPHPIAVPAIPEFVIDLANYPAVTAPASLAVFSTLSANLLEWTTPQTPNYSSTKVYRAEANVFPGEPGLIGTASGGFYYDPIGSGGVARWYWIRHVDINGAETALNATDGTQGTTGFVTDPDIADGTINGEKLVTGTVAADKIVTASLSAISATLGDVVSGTVTLDAQGHIKAGQTAYDTGDGFWMGRFGPLDYRLSIGNSAGHKLTYAGGTLTFTGALVAATGTFAGSLTAATGTFAGDLTAVDGTLGTLTIASGGYIRSGNYVAATTGWALTETGGEINTGLAVKYATVTGGPPADADNTASVLGGSGINIVPAQYCMFLAGTLPPLVEANAANGSYALDTAVGYFKGKSLKLTATADNYGVYLSTGGTAYNIPVTPNRKWILSAYVRGSLASMTGQLHTRRDNAGANTFNSFAFTTSPTANTWTRVSGLIDLSAASDTAVLIRLDHDHDTGNIWFDGIMLEEMVGDLITPSAFDPGGDDVATALEGGTTITAGGITMSAGGSIKGGQTDYNTGVGWFIGYSGGEYKFSIGNPSGNSMTWDGDNLVINGDLDNKYKPGSFYAIEGLTGYTGSLTTPYKRYEYIMDRGGSATFSFSLSKFGVVGVGTAKAQIYKNGVAYGTQRSSTSGTAVVYTQTLTFNKGDAMQLYAWVTDSDADVHIEAFHMLVSNPSQPINVNP